MYFVRAKSHRPFTRRRYDLHRVARFLVEAAERRGCSVPILCVMPDHVHVLMLGLSVASRPHLAMNRLESEVGRVFLGESPRPRAAGRFLHRIVRQKEGYENFAWTIALNPVRAGLADDVYAWPTTDSIGYALREIIEDAWW